MAALLLAAVLSSSCDSVVTDSHSPSHLLIVGPQAASGATPDILGSTLRSDVVTNVRETVGSTPVKVPTIFNDLGHVTFRVQLRDPGQPGLPASPSAINSVTVNQYRVTYRRSDGRNTPGVDVPYAFDGAITVTISGGSDAKADFDLVRHAAKEEAPLIGLVTSPNIITTIADVTFYGRDQAGNTVSASGSISVTFGNFGDPE
jgi:hypothetical protein